MPIRTPAERALWQSSPRANDGERGSRPCEELAVSRAPPHFAFGKCDSPTLLYHPARREETVVLGSLEETRALRYRGDSFALIELEALTARFRIFRKNKAGDWDLLRELRHMKS